MVYGDFKDSPRRIHIILLDKAINIAKNQKYRGCKRGLASVVYDFLIKSL